MRDYGKVHTCFWSSDTTRGMSEDARMLALYLLTCSHGTLAGVFRAPDGYICEDMQWTAERVSVTLSELLAKGFANRCETTKWVWIIKHLEWNPPENPNQRKSALKLAQQIPDQCCWKADYMRDCGELFGLEPTPKEPLPANPSATVPQPVAVAVAVTEVKTPRKKACAVSLPEDFSLTPELLEWAKEKGYSNLPARLEHFVGYAKANGKRYADWNQAFQNAVRDDWAKLNGKATPSSIFAGVE